VSTAAKFESVQLASSTTLCRTLYLVLTVKQHARTLYLVLTVKQHAKDMLQHDLKTAGALPRGNGTSANQLCLRGFTKAMHRKHCIHPAGEKSAH
jgi:hypothetical protein